MRHRPKRPVTSRLACLAAVTLALVTAACGSTGSDAASTTVTAAPSTTAGLGDRGTTETAVPSTSAPTASAATPCTAPRPATPGVSEHKITVDGEVRTYLVSVPESYTGEAMVPLVVTFHGYKSNATQQLRYSRFAALGEREGFITVSPQARGAPPRWDFLSGLDKPKSDARFVKAFLAQVERTYCIDPAQEFASGISNGSAVVFSLMCSGAFPFAAYGGVAGTFYSSACDRAPATSVIYFHGTADPLVPIDGGKSIFVTVKPAAESLAGWAGHDGCATTPQSTMVASDVERRTYPGCRDGTAVELYVIDGGGHTWPGSPGAPEKLGPTTTSIDATALMWAFFERHPRPA